MRIPTMRLVLALAVVCLAPQAFTQTLLTGELTGVVTDPSGASVANAKIDVTNGATGKTFATATGEDGVFRVPLLSPGPYNFTVSAPAFGTYRESTTIAVGFSSALRIQLALETNREIITVTSETPLLQSNDANLVSLINTRFLQNVPNPGNDLTNLAFTTPGVTLNTAGSLGNFSAFGMPVFANLFTVNGTELTGYSHQNLTGASNLLLGANEIQEASVVLNGYTGQYGRLAGANVNYITKSGSNAVHGNAAWMYNGRALNANDWFNNANGISRPFAISNSWAYSAGGPLRKNKLFYFFDHEGMRYSKPATIPIVIPTTDFANYVLTNLASVSPASVPFYDSVFKVYAATPGANRATPVRNETLGCGNFAGSGFGTTLSCARILQAGTNVPSNEWKLAARADYTAGAKDTVFVRFQAGGGRQGTPDFVNPAFAVYSNQPNYTGQIGYTRVWSPRSVNSLMISGTHLSALSSPDITTALRLLPTALTTNGAFTGIGTSNTSPTGVSMTQWQIVDDHSWIRGPHTFRTGVNLRFSRTESYAFAARTAGVLNFANITDFTNASLSNRNTFGQSFSTTGPQTASISSFGFYAEDAWRISPKLSITLAVRLDHNGNPYCADGCFAAFNGGRSFDDIAHAATIPYNQSIQTGLRHAYAKTDALNVQPRIGFAYNLNSKTVLRGGFGIFADAISGLLLDRPMVNPPYVSSFTTRTGIVAPKGTPNSMFDIVANSAAAFQNGFSSGATLAQMQAQVPLFSLPQMYSSATHMRTPRYEKWNLEIQHEIAERVQVSINYVGNRGTNLTMQNMFGNGYSPTGMGGLPTSAPDPRFGNVFETVTRNRSNYNGLVTSAKWRLGRQFTGQLSYTWSHALDLCSNDCLTMGFNVLSSPSLRFQATPPSVPSLAYSHADYDTRHAWAANYVYTPVVTANRALRMIFNNWTVAGTAYFHTGYPFNPLNNAIVNQTFNLNRPMPQQQILAEYRGSGPYPTCTQPNVPCLLAAEFGGASQRSFGNVPRNSFRGPDFFNTDMNLTRTISIREKYRFIVGALFFNVLNHANFDMPIGNVTSPTFGRITQTVSQPTSPYGQNAGSAGSAVSAVSGRVIQTSVRFTF